MSDQPIALCFFALKANSIPDSLESQEFHTLNKCRHITSFIKSGTSQNYCSVCWSFLSIVLYGIITPMLNCQNCSRVLGGKLWGDSPFTFFSTGDSFPLPNFRNVFLCPLLLLLIHAITTCCQSSGQCGRMGSITYALFII